MKEFTWCGSRNLLRRRSGRLSSTVGVVVAALLAVLFIAPHAAAGGTGSISILAPTAFTSASSEYIFVIASVDDEIKDIVLTVNDGPPMAPLKVDDGVYHFRTKLALGLNILELSGSKGGEAVTESVGFFRASKIGMRIRSPFPKYVLHDEQTEAPCNRCHQEDSADDSTDDIIAMNSRCLKCHNPLVSQKYVHGPIAVGTCAICHDFSSEPSKYQLVRESFELCLVCHIKKTTALKEKEFTHGPLGAGLCDICHEPHSSPNDAQLLQPGGEICLVCHKSIENLFSTAAFLHRPFEQRKCSQCHNPHFSDYDFLLRKKGDQLCRSCHEKDLAAHRHPVGVVPRQKLPFEARYGEEGVLVCVTCHDPHAGGRERMLPKEGCPACHLM